MTDPTPTRDEAVLTVDALAQEIRRVDGSHSLGAGALAEALMPFLLASAPAPASGRVDAVLRHYADTFCELGSDHECCGKLSKDECSGCLARSAISPAATPVSEAEPVATVRTIQPLMCEAVIDFIPKQNGHLPFDVGSKLYALAKPASSPAGGDVGDSVALSMDSDMRNSDFETWACKRGYLMHLHEGDESRRYRYSLTEEAWLGWCAALSQSTSAGRVGE